MKRPLPFILGFYILGVFSGLVLIGNSGITPFIWLFAISLLIAFAAFLKLKSKFCFLFPLFTVLGFVLINGKLGIKNADVEKLLLSGEAITVKGVVTGCAKYPDLYYLIVRTDSFSPENGAEINANMSVRVKTDKIFSIGDEITASGVLENLEFKRNPGGYDEFQYLRSSGVEYKMTAEEARKTGRRFVIEEVFSACRVPLSNVYDKVLPTAEASLIKAIVLGDKKGLEPELAQLYRDAGTYHILVASGSHLTIMAYALKLLLGRFLKKTPASILTFMLLVFYWGLTGCSTAMTRALIMWGVILFAEIFYKDHDLPSSICFSALLILLYQPMYLFDAGFQYSYLAVLGLAFLSPAFKTLMEELAARKHLSFLNIKWLLNTLPSALAATLASLPVSAYHFNEISVISVISNIIIASTSSLIIIFGMIVGLTGLIAINAAKFLSGSVYVFLKFYEHLFRLLRNLPYSKLTTGQPKELILLSAFLILISFPIIMRLSKESRKIPAIAVSSVVLVFITAQLLIPKKLIVSYLDVGQGDCAVLNLGKITSVIDGGGYFYQKIGENTGERVLIPYLKNLGVTEVDCAFITHPDRDHATGILELLMSDIKIKYIFFPESVQEDSPLYVEITRLARDKKAAVMFLNSGDTIEIGDLKLECLYPFEPESADTNDSIVLKASCRDADFMFTGDISAKMERVISREYDGLSAEVLKLAHHGSKYSNCEMFLSEVNPRLAVISCSLHNTYGHPAPEVIKRLNDMQIPFLSTSTHGAVIIETAGEHLEIYNMKDLAKWTSIRKS